MKRLAGFAALVLATVGAAILLWRFREIVVLFLLSLAVAATLRPAVQRQAWLRPAWAIGLTYLAALGILAVLVIALANPVLAELRQAADGFVSTYDRIWLEWPAGSSLEQTLIRWLPPPPELYVLLSGQQGATMLRGLLGVTVGLFDGLGRLAIVLALSLYWSLDQTRFERLWLSALPREQRTRARDVWRAIESGVGAYLRSELAQSLMAGVALGIGYWLMGLKYPVLLAVAGALAWLIPWVGALLGLAPALLVGLLAQGGGLWLGLAVGLYTLAIFVAMEFVVEPRLVQRKRYSSLLVALLVLALGQIWGLAGVLAAPPLGAALQILFSQLWPSVMTAPGQVTGQMADLEDRLAQVQAELAAAAQPPAPETLSLLQRLQQLVGQANTATAEPSASSSTPAQ